jgi:hypothetical protein
MVSVASRPPLTRLQPDASAPWPGTYGRRTWLRLALSAPYAVLAFVLWANGYHPEQNQLLLDRGATIRWGDTELSFLDRVNPPMPVAVASLAGSTLVIGILAALAAGTLLHLVVERLVQREVPLALIVPLVVAIGTAPGFLELTSGDLAAFSGLVMLVFALEGFMRFAFLGHTQGGFQAGFALGVATLCDPVALVYAATLALAAPLMAWVRYQGQPGATRATAAVIIFPSVAAAAGWAFLQWRFAGHVVSPVAPDALPGAGEALPRLWDTTRAIGRDLLTAPVYLLCGTLLALRRPLALVGYVLPVVGLFGVLYTGLRYTHAEAALMLILIAAMTVPARPPRAIVAALAGAAILKLGIEWTFAAGNPDIRELLSRLSGG